MRLSRGASMQRHVCPHYPAKMKMTMRTLETRQLKLARELLLRGGVWRPMERPRNGKVLRMLVVENLRGMKRLRVYVHGSSENSGHDKATDGEDVEPSSDTYLIMWMVTRI